MNGSERLLGPPGDSDQGSCSNASRSEGVVPPPFYDPHCHSLVRSCSGPSVIRVSTAGSSAPLTGPRTVQVSTGRLIGPPRRSSAGPLLNSMDKVEEGYSEICLGADMTHAYEDEISGSDAEIYSRYAHSDDRMLPLEDIVPSRDIVLGDKLGCGAFGTV